MVTWRHPLPKAVRIPSEDIAECEQGAERLRAYADELKARSDTRPKGNVVPLKRALNEATDERR